MDAMHLRAACAADLPAILDIYNDVIANSTAVFTLAPATLEERATWLQARQGAGYPVLVAVGGSEVLGFASFAEFRGAWSAYRYSVEHSVHVRRERRGQGVGTLLLRELLAIARRQGKHVMVGGIDAGNEASLRLHARLGFERVAHFREVGHKFGRWLDLVFVQCLLDAPGAPRPER